MNTMPRARSYNYSHVVRPHTGARASASTGRGVIPGSRNEIPLRSITDSRRPPRCATSPGLPVRPRVTTLRIFSRLSRAHSNSFLGRRCRSRSSPRRTPAIQSRYFGDLGITDPLTGVGIDDRAGIAHRCPGGRRWGRSPARSPRCGSSLTKSARHVGHTRPPPCGCRRPNRPGPESGRWLRRRGRCRSLGRPCARHPCPSWPARPPAAARQSSEPNLRC
jgi:hypothetical protein